MEQLFSYIVVGLSNGTVYALVALGFVLIYKTSGVLNIAQGELFVLGPYVAFFFLGIANLPIWAAFILTFVCMGTVAFLIERLALRPMLGQPLLGVILMTLGLAIFLQGMMVLIWGHRPKAMPPVIPTGGYEVAGVLVSYHLLFSFVVALVLLTAISLFVRYSKTGLAMMAAGEDEQTAQSIGIAVTGAIALAWIMSALVSTVGGILLTSIIGVTYTLAGLGLKSITVVLLGGLESIMGVMIAGPLIGILEATAAGYLDPLVGGGVKEVAAFAILIVVLIIRPHGFFGWKRIERV